MKSLCTIIAGSLILGSTTSAELKLTAFRGNPFGVGKLQYTEEETNPDPVLKAIDCSTHRNALLQLGKEAYYPVVDCRPPGRQDGNSGRGWTVYFLFKPAEKVTITAPNGKQLTAAVEEDLHADHADHARDAKKLLKKKLHTLNEWMRKNSSGPKQEFFQDRDHADHTNHAGHAKKTWWKLYSNRVVRNSRGDLYPPSIDQYLTNMLARRLELQPPSFSSFRFLPPDDLTDVFSTIAGTESIRLAMQKDALLGRGGGRSGVMYPLPEAASPPPVEIPEPPADVQVEAISMAVPLECFYARFGSFENFLWFRDRADEWGTDLRDMLAARGMDYQISERLQHQLQISDSALSRILGPAVIRDVAFIGNDTFVREGPGVGILFLAEAGDVLKANLKRQRKAAAATISGCTLQDVKFDGHDTQATFLSVPTNEVRSFYLIHGDYHFVTTSRYLAQKFLDVVAAPETSLGASKEFRYARSKMPVTRDDSLFLYLSDAFFRQLVDPAFRIEMTRRARSENEIQLLQFAQLAASGEGHSLRQIQQLKQLRFLPPNFPIRADESALEVRSNGIVDTLRGARGSFIPVRDVSVKQITEQEFNAYREFARKYRRIWDVMDPAMIGISRTEVDGQEHLKMDLIVYPFAARRYRGLTSFVNGTGKRRVSLPKQAIAVLQGNVFEGTPSFAGILNREIPFWIDDQNRVQMDWTHEPWFSGAVGKAADILLNSANSSKFAIRDNEGVTLAVQAETKELAGELVRGLETEIAERPAQYRLSVGDIAQSPVAPVLHANAWQRAAMMSHGGSTLLNRLSSQLRVPQKAALTTAETLYNGHLISPIGKTYRLKPVLTGVDGAPKRQLWNPAAEVDYKSHRLPILTQVRGVEFELTLEGQTLTSHIELKIDRK